MGNKIDYIRIAAIQFPFIPVIVHPEYNTLSEPEGNINFWIIGKDDQKTKTNVSTLASFLKSTDIDTEILKNLQSDYIDWLIPTVEGVLEFICIKEKPHIILFPEYSLPLEISHKLKEILIKYSERRCIIGGVGSVSIKGEQKKNRFVIINDGEIKNGSCEKMVLTDKEKAWGIVEGEGPILHVLKLYVNDKKQDFPVLITMCNDFIDFSNPPGPVSDKANQECKDKSIKYEEIGGILIPAFTTKTDDMQGRGEAVRKRRIVALANCSFFGDTQIWFPPHRIAGLEDDTSSSIKKGDSACIVAEVPYPPIQVTQPKPKPIGVGSVNISIHQFGCRTYNIKFKNEERENNNSIELDTESFLTLINNRIYKAITYAGIILMGNSHDKVENNRIITTMNVWKELEEKIVSLIPSLPITTYENLPEHITPYLDKIIFGDPYITVVDAIHDLIPSEKKYQKYLEEIKSYINSKDLLPLYMWLNMKKGNDEIGK
jgi:hypothetical protein